MTVPCFRTTSYVSQMFVNGWLGVYNAWLGAWFYTPVATELIETPEFNNEVCLNTLVHVVFSGFSQMSELQGI